jgi:hypothetical protein
VFPGQGTKARSNLSLYCIKDIRIELNNVSMDHEGLFCDFLLIMMRVVDVDVNCDVVQSVYHQRSRLPGMKCDILKSSIPCSMKLYSGSGLVKPRDIGSCSS